MCYNLLEEAWLPVLTNDGYYKRLNIIDTLQHAATIRHLAPSNPMDRFAVFRFLLALCYWCADRTGVPFPHNSDVLPQRWLDYLREQSDCFNLLGEGKRFYQASDANRRKPVTELLQEIPTGNNFDFTRHDVHGGLAFCPTCCAFGLLRLPLYCLSGLPNLKAGINGAPPVYVAAWGGSLIEILRKNWRPMSQAGVPAWEMIIHPDDIAGEIPLLNGLTALPRKIWLHVDLGSPGEVRCSNCGTSTGVRILECEYDQVALMQTDRWTDPHVVYYEAKSGNRTPVKPTNPKGSGAFDFDRHSFKSWFPDLAGQATAFFTVGLSTNNAGYDDVWEQTITIPACDSIEELRAAWDKAVYLLSGRIDFAMNGKTDRNLKKSPARTAYIAQLARPHVEEQVARHMSELLAGDDSYTWDDAANEYQPFMRAAAESLAPQDTVEDARKRVKIEGLKPARKSEGE